MAHQWVPFNINPAAASLLRSLPNIHYLCRWHEYHPFLKIWSSGYGLGWSVFQIFNYLWTRQQCTNNSRVSSWDFDGLKDGAYCDWNGLFINLPKTSKSDGHVLVVHTAMLDFRRFKHSIVSRCEPSPFVEGEGPTGLSTLFPCYSRNVSKWSWQWYYLYSQYKSLLLVKSDFFFFS